MQAAERCGKPHRCAQRLVLPSDRYARRMHKCNLSLQESGTAICDSAPLRVSIARGGFKRDVAIVTALLAATNRATPARTKLPQHCCLHSAARRERRVVLLSRRCSGALRTVRSLTAQRTAQAHAIAAASCKTGMASEINYRDAVLERSDLALFAPPAWLNDRALHFRHEAARGRFGGAVAPARSSGVCLLDAPVRL